MNGVPAPPDTPLPVVPLRNLPVGTGRVEEALPRFPVYTPLMLVLSAVYVVLALAFSARLLDAIDASLSQRQLSSIILWSQALLGFALTLGFWGTTVLPALERSSSGWQWRWLVLVCSGIVALAIAVGIHHSAIRLLTADETGQRGRKAVQLNLLTHVALDARVPVGSLQLDPDIARSPGGKAYLALMLVSNLANGDNSRPTEAALRQAMEGTVAQRLGTAAQVYDNIFVPSVRSLKDAYNAYVAAQTALVDDIKVIHERQVEAWDKYVDDLAKRGLNPARIPTTEWPAIAAEVRSSGIPISEGWNPSDRSAFVTALSAQQHKLANAQYAERLNRLFGAELPPGLEWEQFHVNPIVQARWKAAINAPADALLSPAMGFPAFENNVYRPMIEQIVQPKLSVVTSPAARFASGGDMAAIAEVAKLWIALPAIALIVALIGGIWHGCALVSYATRILLPGWAGRRRFLRLGLAACAVLVIGSRDPVTRSDGFTHLANDIAEQAGPAWLVALGLVETSAFTQPWGDTLRRLALGNQNFGLDRLTVPAQDPEIKLEQLLP